MYRQITLVIVLVKRYVFAPKRSGLGVSNFPTANGRLHGSEWQLSKNADRRLGVATRLWTSVLSASGSSRPISVIGRAQLRAEELPFADRHDTLDALS